MDTIECSWDGGGGVVVFEEEEEVEEEDFSTILVDNNTDRERKIGGKNETERGRERVVDSYVEPRV